MLRLARRSRAESFYARGALARPRAARSTRTLGALQMRLAVLAGVLAVAAAVVFFRSRVAEHRTYDDVPGRLKELRDNSDPTAFFGFHTRDVDALYFVYENGALFLDYELYNSPKEGYAAPFRKTAAAHGFSVTTTSYDQVHTVLRIQLSSVESEAAEQAYGIAHDLFGIKRATRLEFLP